jgi:glycosyltransferase involved in cell wall biosynthesis
VGGGDAAGLEDAMAGMMRRPRLLFLCQTLPYPPDGGVWIRTYHVMRQLAETFEITALCFERAATSGTTPGLKKGLAPLASVEVFPIPQRHSRLRFWCDHLRSAALRRVYTAYVYDSRAFQRRLAELLEIIPFDLIHVDSLDLARYLPACRELPVVCVHHDIESKLLQRRASVDRSAWRSAYFRYQSRRMEEVERRWCPRIALNVTCSEHDRERVAELAPGARIAVVPNGVDTGEFQPDSASGAGIAFVGGTNTFPNRDALEFFASGVLPHLGASARHMPIRWIGRALPDQRRDYAARYGIDLTGYVEDVRPLLRQAACHIVPLRVGGGTRLKILNSWAMGKPVVSTSIGCEGLAAADGDNILIRDDPKDFARAIAAVLDDGELRRRLGERGRATAERLYSWDAIGRAMRETYLTVASHGAGEPAWNSGTIGVEPGYSH